MGTKKLFCYGWWPVRPQNAKQWITERSEYKGSKTVLLRCTQLLCSARDQREIVDDWCEFFHSPSPIRELLLDSRVPVPLFEAVCNQTQLTGLHIKWGPIKDLSPLPKLKNLRRLNLGSCSITDLSPISALSNLECLALENLDRLSDYSPLGKLKSLEYLDIKGAPFMPKDVWMDDLKFLRRLPKLRGLALCAVRFRDGAYYKVFNSLKNLEELDLSIGRLDEKTANLIRSWLPGLKYCHIP